jgi:hypothetical protein
MDNTTITSAPSTTPVYCGLSCLNQSLSNYSGSIASWPFDVTYNDINKVYNGTASANPPTFVTGYIGQAASFNASAQQAIYTSFIPLNSVSFTIEAWIQPTGYPNIQDHSIVGLCPKVIINNCLHINIRHTKLYFGFYYDDVQGATVIPLFQWIHAAFVFDAITKVQTIYLNGIQNGQSTASNVLEVSSGNFTIGVNEGVSFPNGYFQVIEYVFFSNKERDILCFITFRVI